MLEGNPSVGIRRQELQSVSILSAIEFYNVVSVGLYDMAVVDVRATEEYDEMSFRYSRNVPASLAPDLFLKKIRDIQIAARIKKIGLIGNHDSFLFYSPLLDLIKDNGVVGQVYILRDGFQAFQAKFPYLCLPAHKHEKDSPRKFSAVFQSTFPSIIDEDLLFLGDIHDADKKDLLLQLGIQCVINCTPDPNAHEDTFKYLHLEIDDWEEEDIKSHFETAENFIESARKNGHKVLVHCHAGVSRSATITISYLMKTRQWKYKKAYAYLQQRREIVKPNSGFVEQLKTFESVVFAPVRNQYWQASGIQT